MGSYGVRHAALAIVQAINLELVRIAPEKMSGE